MRDYLEVDYPQKVIRLLKFGAPYATATFEIKVANYAPDRWRVRRVLLNGRELPSFRLRHEDIVKGGTLVFEMRQQP